MWRVGETNYLVEDFMEESTEPTLCLECFKKLRVGSTDAEKQFLLSEEVATMVTHAGMHFKQGQCSNCGKEGEVIAYQ
jgi:hypothetical protein